MRPPKLAFRLGLLGLLAGSLLGQGPEPTPTPAPFAGVDPSTLEDSTLRPGPTASSTPAKPGGSPVEKGPSGSGGTAAAGSERVQAQFADYPDARNIGDPMRLRVTVTNRSPAQSILVKQIDLWLPASVLGTRGSTTDWLHPKPSGSDEDNKIAPNSSKPIYFTVPAATGPGGLPLSRPWLAFIPGTYDVRAEISWVSTKGDDSGVTEALARLRLVPDPLALVIGGAVGSWFLALFILFYRVTLRVSESKWPRINVGDSIGSVDWKATTAATKEFILIEFYQGIARAISGTLIAWILLLFLNYARDIQIPVTVAVNDFFGAVLLGLFTHSLGRWVYTRLFDEKDSSSGGSTEGSGKSDGDADAASEKLPPGGKENAKGNPGSGENS